MANILLVDPVSDLKAPLEAAGHDVTWVADGKAALDHLKEKNYDLIATELFLPELDGFDLLRWTETQPPPVPKVIAMTAGAPTMPALPALLLAKAQAVATLQKPFEPDQLVNAVQAVLVPVAELIEPPATRAR